MSLFQNLNVIGEFRGVTASKGDIIVSNGSVNQPLVAADDNYLLATDSASSLGLKWIPNPIITDLAFLQLRRTTTISLTGSYADITFDTIDVATDTTVIERDVANTDRILIKANGFYLISYTTNAIDASIRVRKNDTGIGLAGSDSTVLVAGSEVAILGSTFGASLLNGDFITLQALGNVDITSTLTKIGRAHV